MTFRERLLTALKGERPDTFPWFCDLTYWRHARQADGDYPPEYEGEEGFVALHRDYHVGYFLGYATVSRSTYDNVTVESETHNGLTTTRWVTPVGEIWGQTRYLPETYSGAPVRWPVRDLDDLRVLRYIADATRTDADQSQFLSLRELCGDQGHPTVLPPRSPVSQMLAQWTGATALVYLDADASEELRATLDALGRAADGAYAAIEQSETPFTELPDNLSGEIVTPLFRKYQFDYYVQRIESLHASGKLVGTHLDGTIRGILPLLVETGLDYIESITPAPVGDVPVAELRELAGPDVVLFGGMPGAMFAPQFPRDQVRRHFDSIVEHHWDHGRFVLGSADQIPPDGDMNLVREVGLWCEELIGRGARAGL